MRLVPVSGSSTALLLKLLKSHVFTYAAITAGALLTDFSDEAPYPTALDTDMVDREELL